MQTRPASAYWPEIASRLRGARVLVGLDFDGVLAPIVRRIEAARVTRDVRRAIAALGRRGVTMAVISGRGLADIQRRVPAGMRALAGNHGLEILNGRRYWVEPGAQREARRLPALADALEAAVASIPGAEIERKSLSLAVHSRRTPSAKLAAVERAARAVLSREGRGLRVVAGRRVLEVRPPGAWDKGDALRRLHESFGGAAVFIGDDRGDESAFKAARELGGFGVRVDPRGATAAEYYLPSQRAVAGFLRRLSSLC